MKPRETWLILATLVSAGVYIAASTPHGAVGFPLDDAWIHQVFARNLATRGEFAFFAGQPSAGSTSPLWTILLSIGYLLRVDFRVWTYLLGIALLAASAIIAARFAERLITHHVSRITYHPSASLRTGSSLITFPIALFLVFEWHLVWSATSGMEILLFVFLSLILLERFYARERVWLLGSLAGLLTLTRPEGLVLAALVGVGPMIEPQRHKDRKENKIDNLRVLCAFAVQFGIGFAVVVAPYLLFNLVTSGTIFPNTFYAKSAEYTILFERSSFVVRWLQLLLTPFVGAQILLLPGLLYIIAVLAFKRQWLALIPFAWILLLPGLYALRLPVAYQHGRYEMPVIPFIALYGMWGTAALLARLKNWVVRTTWVLSTAGVLVVFWLLGANAYATDVAIIDCEMVQTARWVAANAPADAVVAAHDIGALGYYYDRPFIDLAGLVTPEVIPFIRDEGRLREYLSSRHATFVIVFPDWYSTFASDPRFVPTQQTNCAVTRETGEKNMVVYRIVQ